MTILEAINDTTFKTTLDSAVVKVGSDLVEFAPIVNLSKWNDRAWLALNHRESVKGEAVLQDGVVSFQSGDFLHKYWPLNNYVFEYSLSFSAPPVNNWIALEISDSDNLRYLFQGELSLEDKALGAIRPDRVVGSYAVYANQKNNEFKTGKIAHLYRWMLVDAKLNKAWAEPLRIDIIDGRQILIIGLPPEFMKSATYPVLAMGAGDTFGITARGGSSTWMGSTNRWANSIGTTGGAEAGAVTDLYCFCANTDESNPHNTELALLASPPGVPLAGEANIAVPANFDSADAEATQSVDVSGDGYSALGSTEYFMGCWQDDSQLRMYYDSMSPVRNLYNNAWDASWSTSGSSEREFSMYFEYTGDSTSSTISTTSSTISTTSSTSSTISTTSSTISTTSSTSSTISTTSSTISTTSSTISTTSSTISTTSSTISTTSSTISTTSSTISTTSSTISTTSSTISTTSSTISTTSSTISTTSSTSSTISASTTISTTSSTSSTISTTSSTISTTSSTISTTTTSTISTTSSTISTTSTVSTTSSTITTTSTISTTSSTITTTSTTTTSPPSALIPAYGFERVSITKGFERASITKGFERKIITGFEYIKGGLTMPHTLTKQINETFEIWGGITNVIASGESIVIANCTVVAVDKDDTDVTATLLDVSTIAVYDTTKVRVRIKAAGTVAASPYKVTFLIKTNEPNTYEIDIFIVIKNR